MVEEPPPQFEEEDEEEGSEVDGEEDVEGGDLIALEPAQSIYRMTNRVTYGDVEV